MDKQINIRQAVASDLSSIVEIWKEYMDFHAALDPTYRRCETGSEVFSEFASKHLSDRNSLVLVAELGDSIIGFCLVFVASRPPVFEESEYGHISDLAVTRSQQRSGIGERLFQEAKDWFAAKGIQRIELRVVVSNEVAATFWKKMGFIPHVEVRVLDL